MNCPRTPHGQSMENPWNAGSVYIEVGCFMPNFETELKQRLLKGLQNVENYTETIIFIGFWPTQPQNLRGPQGPPTPLLSDPLKVWLTSFL